tara:strand:+ start:424 stop:597 length:174 start_codon:yes stop_codon:yes gene_type:complete
VKNSEYINKRVDELLLLMKSEKDIVDFNYGKDWDKVNLYLFKSKSTIKCLKKYINKL